MRIDWSRPLVVVVGCGGVAYHATSLLRVLLSKTGVEKPTIILYDDDKVEAGNLRRQWGYADVGCHKTEALATTLMMDLCNEGQDVEQWPGEIERRDERWLGTGDQLHEMEETVKGLQPTVVLWLAWPDNEKGRVSSLEAVEFLASPDLEGKFLAPIFLWATCGCSGVTANAHAHVIREGVVLWDVRKQGLFERAADEAHVAACGEQTALSNLVGAGMTFHLLEYIEREWEEGTRTSELFWDLDSRKGPRMYSLHHEPEKKEA